MTINVILHDILFLSLKAYTFEHLMNNQTILEIMEKPQGLHNKI
jgi:hypothetical protein